MSNLSTLLYIIRHGESVSNVFSEESSEYHNQWGELESPLTKQGEKQVEQRAKELRYINFAAIFSSDLTRAVQTAEIIAFEQQLTIETTQRIRERKTWPYITKPGDENTSKERIEEAIEKELQKLNEKEKMAYKYHVSMESAEEAANRFLTFLREITISYQGKTVLVVNHGNNIRSLLTYLGYATFGELQEGAIEYTAYLVLESDGIDFSIKKISGVKKTQKITTTL